MVVCIYIANRDTDKSNKTPEICKCFAKCYAAYSYALKFHKYNYRIVGKFGSRKFDKYDESSAICQTKTIQSNSYN